jgi:hypothetical protein
MKTVVNFASVATLRLAVALPALGLLAPLACSPASAPGGSPIATVLRSQCGRCHVPPEPRMRSREQVESAAARHAKRVRLTRDEWTAMIDYLTRGELAGR